MSTEQKATAVRLGEEMHRDGIDFEPIEYVPARNVALTVYSAVVAALESWELPIVRATR